MPHLSRCVPFFAPSVFVAFLTALLMAVSPASAALLSNGNAGGGDDWPSPEQIFQDYLEAIGGERAVRAHTARIIEATVSGADDHFALMTMWQQAPRQVRIRIESPGSPRQEIVFDGDHAWTRVGDRPHSLMGGRSLLDLWETADFYADAAPDERYQELETVGIEEFDGAECYSVRYVTRVNKPGVLFFDVNSGLLRGQRTFQAGGEDWNPLTVYRRDYREHGGVMYPMTHVQETDAGRTTIRYQSVEINPDEMPGFDMPTHLRRELERMREQDEQTPGDELPGGDGGEDDGSNG